MKIFKDDKYTVLDFAGAHDQTCFLALEKKIGSSNHQRLQLFSQEGISLKILGLGSEAWVSTIRSNKAFSQIITWSYNLGEFQLIELSTGLILAKSECLEPQFMGFINDSAFFQNETGKVIQIGDGTYNEEVQLYLLAVSGDGTVRVFLDEMRNQIRVQTNQNELLIPRKGSALPQIEIHGYLILITEIGYEGGVRLFSNPDGARLLEVNNSVALEFKFSTLREGREVISVAYRRSEEGPDKFVFYRLSDLGVTEIASFNYGHRLHAFCSGRMFATALGEIFNI